MSRGPKRILELNSFLAVRTLQSVTGVEDASPEWGQINQEITRKPWVCMEVRKLRLRERIRDGREQIRMLVEQRGNSLTKVTVNRRRVSAQKIKGPDKYNTG